ncbi:CHAP domain-containing protein [Mycobacterium sp. 852014-52144_SCH5372336]|uniref:CHAP domain-containing protein n=1 Tax=Mycobacterium sp. 852014-52144_SCH5372336 TaxID=1834115 RepID=UPI000800252E|nr:CHAP domain-containing protein [Mycobacterium sp. 852014-52144_SCH5372336]OBB77403.1 hypothetical protein A5759_03950 [Mycobacterium sp. 852014-52144_SCH5372336]
MAISGADVEQLRSAATRLQNGANALQESSRFLSGLINNATIWRGADAERFRSQWTSVSVPGITRAADALRQGAEELRRNANEQETASGGGANGGIGTHVGGPASTPSSSSDGAASNNSAAGGNSENARAATAFVDKWQGKMIDPDRSYGAQCFDVFRQYSNEVVGARPGIATTSIAAADIYNHYDRNGVSEFYDRIPFGKGDPQPGDIIVYGGNSYNAGYGHVALITDVNGDKYSVLEQNYGWQDGISGNDPAKVRPHTFSNKADGPILGYLRPK